VLFDETPVGLRRRRSMVEGMLRLEAAAGELAADASAAPTLDVIAAVTLYDYQQLRHGEQPWLPATPRLQALAEGWRTRPSFARSMPHIA
jgi:glutathione S-transferase